MTDYLGPLTLGSSGTTYTLASWDAKVSSSGATVALTVVVTGASVDALASNVETLIAQLRIGNSYVHQRPTATSPVVFTIAACSDITTDQYEGVLAGTPWQAVSFTLALATLPAGAYTALYAAEAVNAPASLSLATLLGTHGTALDVIVDDNNSTDIHSVWCALAPSAVSDSRWLVKASALTWTTMSNGTGAADAWVDGTTRYTTSASWQTAPLDTSTYPQGKYRLLVHVKQSAGTGYVKDSQNDTAVAITRTSMHIMVVGDVDLPVSDTIRGTASNLTLSVQSDGSNTLTVDAFILLPLDYGFFSWHPDTPTTEIDQLNVGPSGIFMDGACDTTYLRGGPLVPKVTAKHVGSLITTASPSGSTWPSDWYRNNSTEVTAASDKFHIETATGSKYARSATTAAIGHVVVPGAWYEMTWTRQVTARSAGSFSMYIYWLDVDGNQVDAEALTTTSSTDASPVNLAYYRRAPVHAARAVMIGIAGTGANITVDFSAVVFRRCPLRLIVVAEEAAGTLSSYYFPVSVSVRYRPTYEVAR